MTNSNARDPVPCTSGGDEVHVIWALLSLEELEGWAAEHKVNVIECGEDLHGNRIFFARYRQFTRVAKIEPAEPPRWIVGFQT